jgi:Raf kinase inhibitor-like YbhB/YbcL family protein
MLRRLALITLVVGACGPGRAPRTVREGPQEVKAMKAEARDTLVLSSPAFAANGGIPSKHTCEGRDVSPALTWSGAPDGTRSLALIVDDPDAPDPRAPRMTWVHWVLYDLPGTTTSLAEGVKAGALPGGTRQGWNDWKQPGWRGPCPPVGRHRYVFKLYALDATLGGLKTPDKAAVERAMQGHVLAQGTLIGTYEKTKP